MDFASSINENAFRNISDSEEEEESIDNIEENDEGEINNGLEGELLFAVQGFGSVKSINGIDIYIKNLHCEDSMKALIKMLRNDPYFNNKLILSKWNIIESDLIPLFVTQNQDKKLAFYITLLLNYKVSILKNEFFKLLMNHLADCLKITSNQTVYNQLIELIFTLIRNVLKIPGNNLHIKTLEIFYEENVFLAIVFISQNLDTPAIKKLCLCLLEIYYHIFKGLNLHEIFMSDEQKKAYMGELFRSRQEDSNRRITNLSSRHSQFVGNYAIKRAVGDSWKVIHRHDKVNEVNKVMSSQYKKPHLRKNVVKEENEQMDYQLLKNLREFIEDFMHHAFSRIVKAFFEEFNNNRSNLIDLDFISFYCIHSTCMKAWRLKREKMNEPMGFEHIISGLQPEFFEVLFYSLKDELQKTSKKDFSLPLYMTSIEVLKEIMKIILLLNNSESIHERRNGQYLTRSILTNNISTFIINGFYKVTDIQTNQIEDILQLMNDYLNLVETQSKGRILIAYKDRKMKNKIKKVKKEYKDSDELNENSSSDESEDEKENYLVEKRYNYESEVGDLIDYQIISKILGLLDKNSLENISDETIESICNYITRIVRVIKAEWMFFQIEYLNIFHKLLINPIFKKSKFSKLFDIIKKIVRKYFEVLSLNKLLVIESFFRFSSKDLKNLILNNYNENQVTNAISKPFYEEVNIGDLKDKNWNQIEDRILLDNYDNFKMLPYPEEQLTKMLIDLGFSGKHQLDVRKRIRKLKLHKGNKTKSVKIFLQEHHESKSTISEIAQNLNQKYSRYTRLTFKSFLEEVLSDFKEYKEFERTFKNQMLKGIYFCIVPKNNQAFEIISQISEIFKILNFTSPAYEHLFWRIPNYFGYSEVNLHIQDLIQLLALEESKESNWNQDSNKENLYKLKPPLTSLGEKKENEKDSMIEIEESIRV